MTEQFARPLEWKVTTISLQQWLVVAPSFAQAVASVEELAGEKVAFLSASG
jgi:hypothetical protein